MSFYQNFWRNPGASTQDAFIKLICKPDFYVDLHDITGLVVTTLGKYLDPHDSILEIGSGTGRNLSGLVEAGFTDVSGIEINPEAVELGRDTFTNLEGVPVQVMPIEEATIEVKDCIYTQSCFMHLPFESEWVFRVVANKARKLIMTIENEKNTNDIAFPRDYGAIFTGLGWREVEYRVGMGLKGHNVNTALRVFTR